MARAASTAKSTDANAAAGEGNAAAPPAPERAVRRRVPSLVLGLAGAALAVAYALVFEKLRAGPTLVMIGLGGMTLVLSAIALWRVIDPLSRAEMPPAAAPRAPQRLRELDREKQLVLKAIKEIELDYQMRKIAEPDYREMIERYRARAMRLISEIEAGDNYRELIERELRDRLAVLGPGSAAPPEPPPEPAAPPVASAGGHSCANCGISNDADAQFCKKCGTKLAAS